MIYSAKELFQDWYNQSIKGDHTSTEISQRREAVNQLLKNASDDFWLDSVRVFYGLQGPGANTYEEYVKACRLQDENFPVKNNQLVVQVLAACALAQKIEGDGRTILADILCLALLTTNYLGRFQEVPLPEVITFAHNIFQNECRLVRKTRDIKKIGIPNAPTIKPIELDLEEEVDDDMSYSTIDLFNSNTEKIQNQFSTALNDLESIHGHQAEMPQVISSLDQNIKIIKEEINVLWWLFGAYSIEFDKPFSKVGFPLLFISTPKELADLTVLLPGLIRVKNYLIKAYSQAAKSVPESLNFYKFIECTELTNEWLDELISDIDSNYEDLTPCLQAFRIFRESGFDNGWKNLFKNKAKISTDATVNCIEFSSQLYYELMLAKCLK